MELSWKYNLFILQDVLPLVIVHPVWARTRPDQPNDTHTGWQFGQPDVPQSNPRGLGEFRFSDVTGDYVNGASYVRDLYDIAG